MLSSLMIAALLATGAAPPPAAAEPKAEAPLKFWCGDERHGPFTVNDDSDDSSQYRCDDSKSVAGRVHLWARAIFAAHKDSPVVSDSPNARERMEKKAASLYKGDQRVRHDPIEIWDD
jgi:hypothetical protein